MELYILEVAKEESSLDTEIAAICTSHANAVAMAKEHLLSKNPDIEWDIDEDGEDWLDTLSEEGEAWIGGYVYRTWQCEANTLVSII